MKNDMNMRDCNIKKNHTHWLLRKLPSLLMHKTNRKTVTQKWIQAMMTGGYRLDLINSQVRLFGC